jgi:hypothetical protein
LLALSKIKSSSYRENTKLSELNQQAQSLIQIVSNWQNYLIAKENKNESEMKNNLQQISSQLSSTPVIPRSFVLRLLNPNAHLVVSPQGKADFSENRLDAIKLKLNESGDSTAALREIDPILSQLSGSSDLSFARAIQSIEVLRKSEPTLSEFEVFSNSRLIQNSENFNRIYILRALDSITLQAVSRSYGIEAPLTKITSTYKVLDSIALESKKQQNWEKFIRSLNSIQNLESNTSTHGNEGFKRTTDLKIAALLQAGKIAEEKNDLEGAAFAYLEASSMDGLYLQRDLAYGKLADLKKQIPEKITQYIAKAEEKKQSLEVAHYKAGLESRYRGMPFGAHTQKEDLSEKLKPMVKEAVAEFLKENRESIKNSPKAPNHKK